MKKIIFFLPILFIAFGSCEEIILEDDISEEQVLLVAPVNNAQFSSTGITFTWEPIENGTEYRIQIAKPNFANPIQIITDNITEETSFTTQLNVGEYEWRVQAVNSGYSSSFSSRFFSIISNDDFGSNSVTLSSPANNIITNTATQTLNWEPVIGATAYHIQIINTANSTIVNEQDVNTTSVNYTFPQGNYQWKIRATNGLQNTLYSSRSILIDTSAPNTPVLVTPSNLSNTSNNTVSFQWTRTSVAGSTETDRIYIYSNSSLTTLVYSNEETSPYITSTLEDGTYYWYVKSYDEAGNVSQQSSVYSFTLN
jgi:hypothetical protein